MFDVATTTYVAVALNVIVAAARARRRGAERTTSRPTASTSPSSRARAGGSDVVYIVIALSGLTALGCEVVWTRLLSLVFGATTYTFSLILAVFLAGLGIGSSVGLGCRRAT